jgi:uncharacterized protein (TIGR02588 family)
MAQGRVPKKVGTPPLEVALGILGGAVVLGLVGYFLFAGFRGDGETHADVQVELLEPARLGQGWVVPFRAVNRGHAPASQILLEAELAPAGGGEPERSEVVLDHLAGRSEQAGGFFFRQDPKAGRLEARALGFLEP